jgi:hypothetical protein
VKGVVMEKGTASFEYAIVVVAAAISNECKGKIAKERTMKVFD